MPTLASAKRDATDIDMPWPDPVKKRLRMDAIKDAMKEKGNREQVGMVFDGYSETDNKPKKKNSTFDKLRAEFPEYPAAMASKIGLSRPDLWSYPSSIYVVTHAKDPRASGKGNAVTVEVVGTYNNMKDANIHVMRLFYEQHKELVEEGIVENDGCPDYERDEDIWCESFWWVDGDQMLSLWATYWDGDRVRVRVRATKHEV